MLIRVSLALIVSALLITGMFFSSAQNSLNAPLNLGSELRVFEVRQGDGLIRVLNALESEALVESATKIRVGLGLRSKSLVVKRGEYQLVEGESVLELLERAIGAGL